MACFNKQAFFMRLDFLRIEAPWFKSLKTVITYEICTSF
jgi:hypothetical protein